MEPRDDGFFVRGGMHCPRCWRLNAPSAAICRECGADLVPEAEPEPIVVKATKKEIDLTWLRGYGVACWIVMAILAIVGVVAFTINLLAGSFGEALMWLVCSMALAAIHLFVGKGLWLMQAWSRTTAFQMHGLMLIWGLATVFVSIAHPRIPYLDQVLSLPVMLALIGGLAIWVGARAEEGERLAVNGPDPDSLAEIAAAPAKVVRANANENAALLNMSPYPQRANLPTATPAPPTTSIYRVNQARNRRLEPAVEVEKDEKQEKMKRTAMMIGATAVLNFLRNRKRAVEADYEDEPATGSRKGKRRNGQRSAAQQRRGGGLMSIIKMFMDQ